MTLQLPPPSRSKRGCLSACRAQCQQSPLTLKMVVPPQAGTQHLKLICAAQTMLQAGAVKPGECSLRSCRHHSSHCSSASAAPRGRSTRGCPPASWRTAGWCAALATCQSRRPAEWTEQGRSAPGSHHTRTVAALPELQTCWGTGFRAWGRVWAGASAVHQDWAVRACSCNTAMRPCKRGAQHQPAHWKRRNRPQRMWLCVITLTVRSLSTSKLGLFKSRCTIGGLQLCR